MEHEADRVGARRRRGLERLDGRYAANLDEQCHAAALAAARAAASIVRSIAAGAADLINAPPINARS
jgi:hypothetical protein